LPEKTLAGSKKALGSLQEQSKRWEVKKRRKEKGCIGKGKR